MELRVNNIIKEIYNKSIANNIPFVRDLTISKICELISDNNYKSLLEIGTAYGYSASIFYFVAKVDVTTIEKDPIRFSIADSYLNSMKGLNLNLGDCFEFEPNKKFDVIFIDGPKRNQIELINKFSKNLNNNGIIIIDNWYLKKFSNIENPSPNQIKILDDIKKLHNWLINIQNNFLYEILDIDDGIAILKNNFKNDI